MGRRPGTNEMTEADKAKLLERLNDAIREVKEDKERLLKALNDALEESRGNPS